MPILKNFSLYSNRFIEAFYLIRLLHTCKWKKCYEDRTCRSSVSFFPSTAESIWSNLAVTCCGQPSHLTPASSCWLCIRLVNCGMTPFRSNILLRRERERAEIKGTSSFEKERERERGKEEEINVRKHLSRKWQLTFTAYCSRGTHTGYIIRKSCIKLRLFSLEEKNHN